MEIYFELEEIDVGNYNTSVALGTFDGLHIGHMEVLNEMKQAAIEKGLKSFVYTFSNHPREFLTPNNIPTKIMDVEEKTQIFTRLEPDYLALIKFDELQLKMEPNEFIEEVLIKKLKMKHLVVGHDYRFGKNASGNVQLLMECSKLYGYTCDVIEPIMKNEIRVSSSLIRELLKEGKIEEANFYLGRYHFVKGFVSEGKRLGKTIGVPTANMRIKDNISTIRPGVYITNTIWKNKMYASITNVGYNPTVQQSGLNMETHIFDFDSDVYGQIIEVQFIKRIRDEIKFESLEALVEQMKLDIKNAKEYFDMQITT